MNYRIYRQIAVLVLPLMFAGCAKFTDIVPKGENRLEKVEELELLVNDYGKLNERPYEHNYLVNDLVPYGPGNRMSELMDNFAKGAPSHNAILTLWDRSENYDRSSIFINGFSSYDRFYEVINRIANPIISRMDKATGDRSKAAQIKSEAYVLRAYYHYLSVNFYAKAYHPATAASDGGVPYADENYDIGKPAEKKTVQQVYDLILKDLNAVDYEALPEMPMNTRIGRAFAYAVKAKVWMSMHEFDSARTAAEKALEVNNYLHDHRNDVRPGTNTPYFFRDKFNPEDLFCIFDDRQGAVLSTDMLESLEEFDIFKNYGDLEKNQIGRMSDGAMNHGQSNTYIIGTQGIFSDFQNGITHPFRYSWLGLTTVDMYLIVAECLLRAGDAGGSGAILDQIRKRRIISDKFVSLGAATIANLKRTSRNETYLTLQNFINLKRWNTEPAWETTLTKTLQISPAGFISTKENAYGNAAFWVPLTPELGTEEEPGKPVITETFTLRPDSPLWIFAFPQTATDFNPNLTQNYLQ